ncbi:MAG: BamA/TamA family outer membrane protein, partial [Spirochaetota bacterium]
AFSYPVFEKAYTPYSGLSLSQYDPRLLRDGITAFGGGIYGKGGFVLAGLLSGSASDMLGEHRVLGILEYYGAKDLSGANADASYWYIKSRCDIGAGVFVQSTPYGILSLDTINELFHNVYDDTSSVKRYGVYSSASYPFTRFLRADMQISSSRYEWEYYHEDPVYANLNTAEVSFIFDNTVHDFLSPIDGWRGAFSAGAAVNVTGQDYSYSTFNADLRRYFYFGRGYSLALRGAGGKIFGKDRESFAYSLGGFSTLRGYAYGEFEGENMWMANAEFRFIFIEGIKFGFPLFFGMGGIGGVLFADAGSAWSGAYQLKNDDGSFADLKCDAGFGVRCAIAPLVSLKLDFAWPFNRKNVGSVNTLLSIGIDY